MVAKSFQGGGRELPIRGSKTERGKNCVRKLKKPGEQNMDCEVGERRKTRTQVNVERGDRGFQIGCTN